MNTRDIINRLTYHHFKPKLMFVILLFVLTGCHHSNHTQKPVSSSPPKASIHKPAYAVKPNGGDAGMGHRLLSYAVTNLTDSVRTLYGYPKIVLMDSLRKPIKNIKMRESAGSYFQLFKKPQKVRIAPDSVASFEIAYTVIQTAHYPCLNVSYISISLPGDDHSFVFHRKMRICGGYLRVAPFKKGKSMD